MKPASHCYEDANCATTHTKHSWPELIPRNIEALPARTRVRPTCGVHAAPPTACVWAFGRMQPCNGGTLFTWSEASLTHSRFHSSFYFSSSPWEWKWRGGGVRLHVYASFFMPSDFFSIFIFLPTSLNFLFSSTFSLCLPPCHLSISFTLLSFCLPFSLPWAGWATAGLSVRIWIIEVYWVWSADGEMAVMDLSALFRNHRVCADTCPVKARGALQNLQWQWGSWARHALKKDGSGPDHICTGAYSHMQVHTRHGNTQMSGEGHASKKWE